MANVFRGRQESIESAGYSAGGTPRHTPRGSITYGNSSPSVAQLHVSPSSFKSSTLKEQERETQRLQRENFELKSQVFYMKEKLKKLNGDHGVDLQNEVMDLKLHVEELTLELEEKKAIMKKAQAALETMKEDLDDNRRRLRECNPETMQALQQELAEKKASLKIAVDAATVENLQRQEAETAYQQAKLEMESDKQCLVDLQIKNAQLESDLDKSNTELQQAQTMCQALRLQSEELQQNVQRLGGRMSAAEDESKQVEHLRKELVLLRELLDIERQRSKETEGLYQDKMKELFELKQEVLQDRQQLSAQQARENELVSRLADAASKETQLVEQLQELEETTQQSRRQCAAAQRDKEELGSNLRRLQATLHKTQETGEQAKTEGEKSQSELLSTMVQEREMLRRLEAKVEEYKRKAKQSDRDRLKREHMIRSMMQRWEETLDLFIADVLPTAKNKQEAFLFSVPNDDSPAPVLGEGELVGFVERTRGKLELVRGVKHSLRQACEAHISQMEQKVKAALKEVSSCVNRVEKAEGSLSRVRIYVAGGEQERRERSNMLENFMRKEKEDELKRSQVDFQKREATLKQEKADLGVIIQKLKTKNEKLQAEVAQLKIDHALELKDAQELSRINHKEELQAERDKLELQQQQVIAKLREDEARWIEVCERERQSLLATIEEQKQSLEKQNNETCEKLKVDHVQELEAVLREADAEKKEEFDQLQARAEQEIQSLQQEYEHELIGLRDIKSSLESKLKEAEEQNGQLNIKLSESNSRVERFENECESLHKELFLIREENIELKTTCQSLSNSDAVGQQLRTRYNQLEAEAQTLKKDLETAQRNLSGYESLKAECVNFRQTMDRLRAQISQRDKLISKYLEQFASGTYEDEGVERLILSQVEETRLLIASTQLLLEEDRQRNQRQGMEMLVNQPETPRNRRMSGAFNDGELCQLGRELITHIVRLEELVRDIETLLDRSQSQLDRIFFTEESQPNRNNNPGPSLGWLSGRGKDASQILQSLDQDYFQLLDGNAHLSLKVQQYALDLRRLHRRFKSLEDKTAIDFQSGRPGDDRNSVHSSDAVNTTRVNRWPYTQRRDSTVSYTVPTHSDLRERDEVQGYGSSTQRRRPGSSCSDTYISTNVNPSSIARTYSFNPRRTATSLYDEPNGPSRFGATSYAPSNVSVSSNEYSPHCGDDSFVLDSTPTSPRFPRSEFKPELKSNSIERLRLMDRNVQEIKNRLKSLEKKALF